MSDDLDLHRIEERLGAVERRSHLLVLAGLAVAGMAAAAWLVWRARRRAAARVASPPGRRGPRPRRVVEAGRLPSRRAGAKKPLPRRQQTD